MAKKTKNSNLSIKERLEQALIPNWDEPYKLPPNWGWVRVDAIASIYTGNSINERVKEEKYTGRTDGFVYLATKDIDFDSTIDYETNVCIPQSDGFKVAPKYSTLLCIEGGSAGRKIGFITQDVCFVNKLCAFVPHSKINPKYLYYAIQSDAFKKQFDAKKHGLIGGVSVKEVSSIFIPFAPVEIQNKIVEHIESVFNKLDEAKEKAQEVVDGFETRKAAILHKAFSGELTAKWREENEIPANSWQETKLGYVLREIKYGSSEKSDYSYTGIPVLRIPNIGDMGLIFDDLKFLRQNDCLPNEYLEKNDILIIRSNGSKDLVGKCALVKDLDQKYTYASFLIRLRVLDGVYSPYIVWYLNSESARKQLFRKAKSSAGIHNINSKEISDIDIKIPRIPEQEKIVENLSALMEKEKQAKEIAEAVIEQIDTMKKAILARAFRGELGTNDPSEESAVELLKKVLGGDAVVQTPAKKPTKRILISSDIKELLSNIREEEIIKLLLKSAPQPVSIQEIMSLSSKKFELMDALRSLEKKQLITKNESGDYSLTR